MTRRLRLVLTSLAILGLPFAIGLIRSDGLEHPLPTFHDGDEALYHYPTIQKFAAALPSVDVRDYDSATTPLFHMLLATASRVFDLDLAGLRWLNLGFSYAAILGLSLFLARRFRSHRDVLLLALVFCLTPYFFGRAFRLFTENLAFGLCVLGLYLTERARNNPAGLGWVGSVGSLVGAVLTRQSTVWVPAAVAAEELAAGGKSSRLPRALAVVGAPLLALAPFFYLWGGLVPPTFQKVNVSQMLNVRAVLFALAVLGFYSILVVPKAVLQHLRHPGRLELLAAILGVASVVIGQVSPRHGDDGFLWRIAAGLPNVGGGNLLFIFLVPLGLIITLGGIRSPGALPRFFFPLFALSFAASGRIFQNYYDSYVLLFLFDRLAADGEDLGTLNRAGMLVLAGMSLVYLSVRTP